MRKIFAISLSILLTGCFGPSAEQKQRAETVCEKFVLEKLGEFGDESHIFDTYSKDGKIVVEVGLREGERWRGRGDNSYSVRLCVYDEEKGTIEIPSLLNMGQWKK
jgi:hypothetical protein